MLMYNPSILSIIRPEPSLIHMSNRFSISSNEYLKDIFDLLLFLLVN